MQKQIPTTFCDMRKTIEMGQFFRYDKISDNEYYVYARDQMCQVLVHDDIQILTADNMGFWFKYFDFETDYNKINHTLRTFCEHHNDNYGVYCIDTYRGIRIANQDYLEACVEYLFSAQNTVSNIRNIMKKLCCNFGEKKYSKSLNKYYFTFPTLESLKSMDVKDFELIKAGFRSPYIVSFLGDFKVLSENNSYEEIMKTLLSYKGIGPKVASCIALYGLRQLDAFPIDSQIKKALELHYSEKNPFIIPDKYAGILQAYMYWDIRHS